MPGIFVRLAVTTLLLVVLLINPLSIDCATPDGPATNEIMMIGIDNSGNYYLYHIYRPSQQTYYEYTKFTYLLKIPFTAGKPERNLIRKTHHLDKTTFGNWVTRKIVDNSDKLKTIFDSTKITPVLPSSLLDNYFIGYENEQGLILSNKGNSNRVDVVLMNTQAINRLAAIQWAKRDASFSAYNNHALINYYESEQHYFFHITADVDNRYLDSTLIVAIEKSRVNQLIKRLKWLIKRKERQQ